MLISARDFQVLQQKGYVGASDYERVPAEQVVYEIDQDGLTSRIVGATMHQEYVMKAVQDARKVERLLRPGDLVDKASIARKTGRVKSVVTEHWSRHPTFPRPVLTIGGHDAYYWPDVKDWLRSRDLPLRKQSGAKPLGNRKIARQPKGKR